MGMLFFKGYLMTTESLNELVEKIRMIEITKNSEMTEEQSWDLSEELKQNWWDEHGKDFLAKAGINYE
jgi:hypothetical protein